MILDMSNKYNQIIIWKLKIQHNLFLRLSRKILTRHFSNQMIKEILRESKQEFRNLLERIPFNGKKSKSLTPFLLKSAICVPIANVLKKMKIKTRTIGKILYDCSERSFAIIQKPFKKRFRKNLFSNAHKQKMSDLSKREPTSLAPFDWKVEYQEDGLDKYTIIFHECGICKFWKQENLEELVPYMCLTDYIKWDNADVNVKRTQTLANGAKFCDFHFIGLRSSGYRGWPPEDAQEWSGKYDN